MSLTAPKIFSEHMSNLQINVKCDKVNKNLEATSIKHTFHFFLLGRQLTVLEYVL